MTDYEASIKLRYSWGSLIESKIDLFALYAHLNFSTIKSREKYYTGQDGAETNAKFKINTKDIEVITTNENFRRVLWK